MGVGERGLLSLNTLLPKYLNTLVFCKIPLEKGSIERFYVYIFLAGRMVLGSYKGLVGG